MLRLLLGSRGWMSEASVSYPVVWYREDRESIEMKITDLFSALHAQGFDLLQWSVLLCRCVGLFSALIRVLGKVIGFVRHGPDRGEEVTRHDDKNKE